ncbi:MAG: hypothetical protein J7L55_02795 [Desulfurococcales archaeon]|nr:hypothetical protein [Desulfurococcales archaeon]
METSYCLGVGVFFRRKRLDRATARVEIAKVLIDLKQLHKRAFFYRSRLETKIRDYTEKISYISDPKLRDSYLKSIEMYRQALSAISSVEATLELLIVRLETLGLLGTSVKELLMIKEVLRNIKGSAQLIPDLSLIAEDISERVSDLLEYFPVSRDLIVSASAEAKSIIQEAEVVAKEKEKGSVALEF